MGIANLAHKEGKNLVNVIQWTSVGGLSDLNAVTARVI